MVALLALHGPLPAFTVARPAFETETWPEGRTLIWANPGPSGDIGDAAQCKESGGKAATTPPDCDKHTFFRLDEGAWRDEQHKHEYQHPKHRVPELPQSRTQISHKFQVAKYGTASVEFFGNVGVSDEVMLQHGKLIVSGDFRFSGITGKGTLEIQSGGRVCPFDPGHSKMVYNFNIYRNGVIQAGSPERRHRAQRVGGLAAVLQTSLIS